MEKTILWREEQKPARLMVVTSAKVETYPMHKHTTLGRGSANQTVDIVLPFNFVSRNHGVFDLDENGCYYMDVGSGNGTLHNGKKVLAHQKQYLANGDVLKIVHSHQVDRKEIICMIYATDYPDSYEWDAIVNLDNISEISIGRGNGNRLGLQDQAISVNHACFFSAENGWNVVDYNSTNGVFVNGVRVVGQRQIFVGDCIRIINVNFIFKGNHFVYQKGKQLLQNSAVQTNTRQDDTTPLQQQPQPMIHNKASGEVLSIQIVERSVWQRAKKLMLLQNINMNIQNGELVLILGGSGAGKTTFMNAVMGYEKAEGKIVHANVDIYKNFASVKHKIGFVPQLDLLRGSDTVYDTLSNAAEMKLSASMGELERMQRVEKVLATLGLQRERHSLVSKLSGGQRKRLSIAVEYIADPSLFFLDEPDSGLDGIMARTLMQNLRTIADEDKIVMVISHAPDRVAKLFDKIIVLAKSTQDNCGHLAFFGSVTEGLRFFESDSLEGIVQRINRADEGGDGLADAYIEKYKQMIEGGV